jgi:hypothetical protein
MKHQQEVHKINNRIYFLNFVRKEATNTFLVIFQKTQEFIDIYEECLLSDDLIQFEANKYIFENPDNPSQLFVYEDDIEKIIKNIYRELVERVLNKLVDAGILEMCWDNKLSEVIWRKKKGVHVSRRIKKINRRNP